MKKRHLARTQAAATVLGKGLVKVTIDPAFKVCEKIADEYRKAKRDISIDHAAKHWDDLTPDEQFKAAWAEFNMPSNMEILHDLPTSAPIPALYKTLRYQFKENQYKGPDWQKNERGIMAYKHLLQLGVSKEVINKYVKGSVEHYDDLIEGEVKV